MQVGRTKSCPVASSRPQRLMAIQDLQDASLAAPLALRSRGEFMWPPTTLPTLESIQSNPFTNQLIPANLHETPLQSQNTATPVETSLTPRVSLAASSQTPSPTVSPQGHQTSSSHDRTSPCTERDSVRPLSYRKQKKYIYSLKKNPKKKPANFFTQTLRRIH